MGGEVKVNGHGKVVERMVTAGAEGAAVGTNDEEVLARREGRRIDWNVLLDGRVPTGAGVAGGGPESGVGVVVDEIEGTVEGGRVEGDDLGGGG
jgi:hypothetical protein